MGSIIGNDWEIIYKNNTNTWKQVEKKSLENIYMQFACGTKVTKDIKYKNLNQCMKIELNNSGGCTTDTDCYKEVSACWKYLPKSCYFHPYGIACDPIPKGCTKNNLGMTECPEFGQ